MPENLSEPSERATAHVVVADSYPTRPWIEAMPMIAATRSDEDRNDRCDELLERETATLIFGSRRQAAPTANHGRRRADRELHVRGHAKELTGAHRGR